MKAFNIAALPGDGIGPEVMDATLVVLHRCAELAQRTLHIDSLADAGAEHYRRSGEVLPQSVLDACCQADAVLLAAIGLPDVRFPDNTEVQPTMMVGLRRAMELYAAVRPIKLYPGVLSPLRAVDDELDFVIVRENSEGLFSSFGGGYILEDQVAGDSLVITRKGTERVSRFAFELAQRRQAASGRSAKVTCVDKANVFRSFAFFRKVFLETAASFPEVTASAEYVDAASLLMVQQPERYDVIVTENQFGDILSDLGAALVGGLGMGPSAEVGDQHALFQPSHGTAPDIAGKSIANPLATILSAAMMLEWLGERHSDDVARAMATAIELAVSQTLSAGQTLPQDLGGTASTGEVAEAVAAALPTRIG